MESIKPIWPGVIIWTQSKPLYISDSGTITVWSTDNNSRKLDYLTFIFQNPENT
jgi:hypothetical protein